MAFRARDTSRYFEQAQPQGSPLDSILPILLAVAGKAAARRSSGTGSIVDTYLNLSQGLPPEAPAAHVASTPPASAAPTPPAALPQAPVVPLIAPKARVKAKGCGIDPRTGKFT